MTVVRGPRRVSIALLVLIVLVVACTRSSDEGSHDSADPETVDTLGLLFTDVSEDAGLTAVQAPRPFYGDDSMTSGAAVADVDGDGYDDIFLTRVGTSNVLYLNNGDGTFRDATEAAGLLEKDPTYGSSAAAFFDADGDGNLDLFVTTFGRGQNRLFMNNGDGTFVDQTVERGISFPPLPSDVDVAQMHGVTVGDVNGDGHLDLLVLHWYTDGLLGDIDAIYELAESKGIDDPMGMGACQIAGFVDELNTSSARTGSHSRLFINDGTGHFSDATERVGLDLSAVVAFTGIFIDYDGDGWQDLAVTGDGCTSRLYRNVNGEHFEDVTKETGVGKDENGMGAVFKDLNGDGFPDWLVSAISYGAPGEECIVGGSLIGCSGNRLYLNDGTGHFEDAAVDMGLRDGGWGWGVAVEDFANTGNQQVVMTNGYLRPEALAALQRDDQTDDLDPYTTFMSHFVADPTRFWMTAPDGRFVDVAKRVGITDTGLGHALVPFDFDNDGRLDILIAQTSERPVLYRNDGPGDRSWLTIRLDDPSSPGNRWGDGARVEIFTDDSDPGLREKDRSATTAAPRTVGWITTGGSYESQKPPQFHVGFGDRSPDTARVEVYWPGETTPQTVTDVTLNQRIVIERDHD